MKFLGILLVLFILFSITMFILEVWDIIQVLLWIMYGVIYLLLLAFFSWALYHGLIEKMMAERNRERSKVILTDYMGKTRQVSGDTRAGKDTAVVGASRLIEEIELERDLQEMKSMREILYIYDFNRLHEYIDNYGKAFLVSGRQRLLNKFTRAMVTNESFIKQSFLKSKSIDPVHHVMSYIKTHDTKVQQFTLHDGLTPGGRPFVELLFEYVIIYTYRVYVTNFVLSNQPILEALEIDKDGNIKKHFSKKFSHKYMKIKLDGPLPWPLRGVIIQTEMAIMLSNVDQLGEAMAKSINGIREFFTIYGHLMQERVYLFDIVQDPNRQIKAVRELYQTYLHVFNKKEICTAPIRRTINQKRVEVLQLQIKFQSLILRTARMKSFQYKITQKRIDVMSEKIFNLKQRNEQLNSKGYLKIYIGVYGKLEDVAKNVKFPRLKVKLDSTNENIVSKAYGFVLHVRKTDSFGRFNTHFMEWIREQRQAKYKMHFADIENWTSFEVTAEDAISTDYDPMKELATTVEEQLTDKSKAEQQIKLLLEVQKQNPDKFKELLKTSGVYKESLDIMRKQKREKAKRQLPNFSLLTMDELIAHSKDLGINVPSIKETYGQLVYRYAMPNKKEFDTSGFDNLTMDEVYQLVTNLEKRHHICLIRDFETKWRQSLEQLVIVEYRAMFAAHKI